MSERDDVKKRKPTQKNQIRKAQQRCYELDDEPRWLLALISDTVLRLSEAVGLAISDIKLNAATPHSNVQLHPWRSLKTKSSHREAPLVSEGCVLHSFRHSMRDRLRVVECPKEIIDQIGGWSSSDIGESYGDGFLLSNVIT